MRLRQLVDAMKGFDYNLSLSTLKEQSANRRKKIIFVFHNGKQ